MSTLKLIHIAVCVGFRGSRIKAVREELAGEHIDVVRYNEDPEVLIPNALQPAEVEQVLLCDMIGRAIVLVQEDQLSLAIGRRGQNVRLASKLCGWDIEIMTGSELEAQIERAVTGFSDIDGVTEEIAQSLVEQGYLSYDDLSVIEPDLFMEMSGLTSEQVDYIVEVAETRAEEAEQAAAEERRARKERERLQREAEAAGISEPSDGEDSPSSDAEADETVTEPTSDAAPAEGETANNETAQSDASETPVEGSVDAESNQEDTEIAQPEESKTE